MDQIESYIVMLGIIITVGALFGKSTVPISLLLVITGMLASFLPFIPHITLNPYIVLNIFLPLLVYRSSAELSWRDFRVNIQPITSLSIGHVVFITILVALTAHYFIPEIGWPMAFLLGAVVSPPDAVAIVSIAQKIHMPHSLITILKGEALLNDATALILFRFALAAVLTHSFSAAHATLAFFLVVIGETIYGFLLGHISGKLRLLISDPMLQMLISLITPFVAYLPAERLGGSGVISTVVAGMVIGHVYMEQLPPEVRLNLRSSWVMIDFIMQSLLFLLVGLDMRYVMVRISSISISSLCIFGFAIVGAVILGRFIWIYSSTYLLRLLSVSAYKKPRKIPWQYPFTLSWSGMRGGISLAAALAVPMLPMTVEGVNARDLLVFLVFCVITITLLIQGLTLPSMLKWLGIHARGERENYNDHLSELSARHKITRSVLHWLAQQKIEVEENPRLLNEIKFLIRKYRINKNRLEKTIKMHGGDNLQDEDGEIKEILYISSEIIEVERKTLLHLWHDNKISYAVKNKLLEYLDHRSKNLS